MTNLPEPASAPDHEERQRRRMIASIWAAAICSAAAIVALAFRGGGDEPPATPDDPSIAEQRPAPPVAAAPEEKAGPGTSAPTPPPDAEQTAQVEREIREQQEALSRKLAEAKLKEEQKRPESGPEVIPAPPPPAEPKKDPPAEPPKTAAPPPKVERPSSAPKEGASSSAKATEDKTEGKPAPPKRTLEAEPAVTAKPAGWDRVAAELHKLVPEGRASDIAGAARRVAAWDSAESASKLVTAFLRCVKQLESNDAQDQKLSRLLDDLAEQMVRAFYRNPNSDETEARRRQFKAAEAEQAALTARILDGDAMLGAILDAIASYRSAEALRTLVKQAHSTTSVRYRARLVEALGGIPTATALAGLLEFLTRKANEIQALAAIRAIRALGVATDPVANALAEALQSPQWQVRVTAAQAIAETGCTAKVEALVEILKTTSGQPAADVNEALKTLTGVDKHGNYDAWRAWWERNREAVIAGTYRPEAMEQAGAGGSTTFYGLPVVSNNVAFVVDISGSMEATAEWNPPTEEARQLGLKLAGNRRIDVAKYELKKVILKLPVNARLALIFYEDNVHVYSGGPIRLTDGRRKSVLDFIDGVKLGAMTNMWGGLSKALSYAGDGTVPNLKDDGIDTIFKLTDGVPTVGITETPKLLRRFAYLNRYSMVRVHTVHIGDDAGAGDLLQGLSKATGGIYRSDAGARK